MNNHYLAAIMLLLCAGCARTTIESKTQPGYTFTDARLLVIQQLSADAIQQGFKDSLPTYMSSCGVTTINDVIPATPHDTEDDRAELKQREVNLAQQNGTNAYLTIVHDSTLVATHWGIAAGAVNHSYHATLQDNQGNKLWTSLITLKPNELVKGGIAGTNTEGMGKILAHDLVDQLRKDNVLTRCPAELPE